MAFSHIFKPQSQCCEAIISGFEIHYFVLMSILGLNSPENGIRTEKFRFAIVVLWLVIGI